MTTLKNKLKNNKEFSHSRQKLMDTWYDLWQSFINENEKATQENILKLIQNHDFNLDKIYNPNVSMNTQSIPEPLSSFLKEKLIKAGGVGGNNISLLGVTSVLGTKTTFETALEFFKKNGLIEGNPVKAHTRKLDFYLLNIRSIEENDEEFFQKILQTTCSERNIVDILLDHNINFYPDNIIKHICDNNLAFEAYTDTPTKFFSYLAENKDEENIWKIAKNANTGRLGYIGFELLRKNKTEDFIYLNNTIQKYSNQEISLINLTFDNANQQLKNSNIKKSEFNVLKKKIEYIVLNQEQSYKPKTKHKML